MILALCEVVSTVCKSAGRTTTKLKWGTKDSGCANPHHQQIKGVVIFLDTPKNPRHASASVYSPYFATLPRLFKPILLLFLWDRLMIDKAALLNMKRLQVSLTSKCMPLYALESVGELVSRPDSKLMMICDQDGEEYLSPLGQESLSGCINSGVWYVWRELEAWRSMVEVAQTWGWKARRSFRSSSILNHETNASKRSVWKQINKLSLRRVWKWLKVSKEDLQVVFQRVRQKIVMNQIHDESGIWMTEK